MFTGIIQGLGEVAAMRHEGGECRFSFKPLFNLAALADGESIAVNGACLSVESHGGGRFTAYASRETMARTTLGKLRRGSRVNLERALALGERLGGHLVSGHVDCLAIVEKKESVGQSILCGLRFPPEYSAEVVAKGSVALDGISLTVNVCGEGYLEVNVIPDSQKRTNFSSWARGSEINMETDIIGKYVAKYLRGFSQGEAAAKRTGGLDREFLFKNGFI